MYDFKRPNIFIFSCRSLFRVSLLAIVLREESDLGPSDHERERETILLPMFNISQKSTDVMACHTTGSEQAHEIEDNQQQIIGFSHAFAQIFVVRMLDRGEDMHMKRFSRLRLPVKRTGKSIDTDSIDSLPILTVPLAEGIELRLAALWNGTRGSPDDRRWLLPPASW